MQCAISVECAANKRASFVQFLWWFNTEAAVFGSIEREYHLILLQTWHHARKFYQRAMERQPKGGAVNWVITVWLFHHCYCHLALSRKTNKQTRDVMTWHDRWRTNSTVCGSLQTQRRRIANKYATDRWHGYKGERCGSYVSQSVSQCGGRPDWCLSRHLSAFILIKNELQLIFSFQERSTLRRRFDLRQNFLSIKRRATPGGRFINRQCACVTPPQVAFE